jgi:hypothetical protein
MIVNMFTSGAISPKDINPKAFKVGNIAAISLVLFFNIFYYGRKSFIEGLQEKFKAHKLNGRIRVWMIFTLIPIIIVLAVLIVVINK